MSSLSPKERDSRVSPSAGVSSSCPTGKASTAAESETWDPRDPDTSGPPCLDPDRWDTTRGPSSTRRSSRSEPRVPRSPPREDSSTTERSGTPTSSSTDPFPDPPRGSSGSEMQPDSPREQQPRQSTSPMCRPSPSRGHELTDNR